ncbi:MAG: hypothetical protein ACFFAT_05730, partial [Promethearchaeota archaeon]
FEILISILLLITKFFLIDSIVKEIMFLISFILTILTLSLFIFIISLNILLINPTIKRIKIKLVPIVISQILIIFSLILEIFTPINIYPSLFFLIGLALIFLSIYSGSIINAFLEIKGSETLKALYIINSIDNRCLYHYDFTQKDQNDIRIDKLSSNSYQKVEDLFFSHGIEGIEHVIASITNTQEDKIQSISQGDSLLLLEHGSKSFIPLTYVLIADKEQKNMRFLLNTFKNQFESFYKEILMNFQVLKENQALVFSSFDIFVKNIMN